MADIFSVKDPSLAVLPGLLAKMAHVATALGFFLCMNEGVICGEFLYLAPNFQS